MSTFEATLHQLPKPILDKLRAIIARVRRLLFVRGFFATLAVGLGCLLAIMAIDATVTLFSGAARWALSLAGLGATLLTAWRFLLRPLSRKITLTHIARILEIRHPELQERISTAVELMSSDDPESIKGSEELIAAVVESAVIDVGKVDPATEFKAGRASKFILAAGAAAVVLALLFAIWPRQAGVLVARAVAPFLDIGNAWSETLTVRPGDVRVAIGDPVTIDLSVGSDRLKRVEIRRKLAGGGESVERMALLGRVEKGGRRRFSITFPVVDESFEYRIRAGSALSEFYSVEAVPKPVVEKLTLRYDFPAYTGRQPAEAVSENGEIRALAHTEVTVTADLNKPVAGSGLSIRGVPLEVEQKIEDRRVSWRFTLEPETEGFWRMHLEDGDGFENEATDRPVKALPDLAPRVEITSPGFREMRLRPSELLPIRYSIAEDIGLGEVTLLVAPNGERRPREMVQPSPEVSSDGQPGVWHGLASLNLAALDLKPGQTRLTVQLRVRDNLPAEFDGPNEGFSEKLTVIIDAHAKSLAEQTLAAQKEEIKKAIDEAERELQQAKAEATQAERRLAREDKVTTETMRDLEDFRERANSAQETLREIAKTAEDTIFQPQGEKLKKVADEKVADARESADMIPVTDKKEQRVAEAREAAGKVDEALRELVEIEESLNDADENLRMVAELNELANEQRKLARDAARQAAENAARREAMEQRTQSANQQARQKQRQQLTAEEMKKLAEFRREQGQVQRDLGEMLKESSEALRDILAKQQQEAARLAEETEAIAGEQEQVREMTEQGARAEEGRQEALRQQLMASLRQRQQQVAEETQGLREQLDQQQEDAGKPLEGASEQTQRAADSLREENMESAKDAAKQANEALAQASRQAEALAEQQAGQKKDEASGPADASQGKENPQSPRIAQGESGEKPVARPDPGETSGEAPGEKGEENGRPQQPGQPPSPSSSSPSPLAAEPTRGQLTQLAREQENISQQLQAIEEGRLEDALSEMEQALAQESGSLQRQTEALEQETEAARQFDAKSRADQAENALESAAQQASQASKQLDQAQQAQDSARRQGQPTDQPAPQTQQAMNQSRGKQQEAQQKMSQAAQALRQASEMLAQSLQNMQATPEQESDVLDPENLSEAFDDTGESAQSQDSKEAAQNAQEAAESLQQLAQAAMEQMGAMGKLSQQPGQPDPRMQPEFVEGADPQLNETGMKTADINGDGVPPELEALGISAADWARLKGNLRSGGATQGGDDLPAEYRELVGRYFQVIAKEAARDE